MQALPFERHFRVVWAVWDRQQDESLEVGRIFLVRQAGFLFIATARYPAGEQVNVEVALADRQRVQGVLEIESADHVRPDVYAYEARWLQMSEAHQDIYREVLAGLSRSSLGDAFTRFHFPVS